MKNTKTLKDIHYMYKKDREVFDDLNGLMILFGLFSTFISIIFLIHVVSFPAFDHNGILGFLLRFLCSLPIYLWLFFCLGIAIAQEHAFCGEKLTKVLKFIVKLLFHKEIYATDIGNDIYNGYKVIKNYSVKKCAEPSYIALDDKYEEPRCSYVLNLENSLSFNIISIPISESMYHNLSYSFENGAEMIISCDEYAALLETQDVSVSNT